MGGAFSALKEMKDFLLFRKDTSGMTSGQKVLFWAWNAAALLVASVCLGALCLSFAIGIYGVPMLKSYFANGWIFLLNIAPVVLLSFLLWAVVRRTWIAFLITAVPTLALAIANYLKIKFRNDPLLFEDILYLREALKMSGNYSAGVDKRIVIGIALVLAAAAVLFFIARGKPKKFGRLGVLAAVIILFLPLRPMYARENVYTVKTRNTALINQWGATQNYICRGNVYPFLYSMNSAFDRKPAGYDAQEAKALLAAYEESDIPEDKKVSVVGIMLESFSDISSWEQLQLRDDPYAAYHELKEQGYSGVLVDDIFAGGTIQTERSFLTGLSNFGSLRRKTDSYAWYFRSQGYAAEGLHPCYEWFYNRLNINENLGFEDYYFVENLFGQYTGGTVGYDDLFFRELKKFCTGGLESGKPLFSFSVTYQGHGPYNDDIVWWEGDHVANENLAGTSMNILNNYLDCIQDTSERLLDFADYLNGREEPVILVVFGDHKPWLGDSNSVYHELGVNLDTGTAEGFLNYYSTEYIIWANDAAKETLGNDFKGEGPMVGPYFLMNVLFDLCSWDGPAFMKYTDGVMQKVQAANIENVYVENGEITRSLSEEAAKKLDEYLRVQYYVKKNFKY
ncbi:MAG: LTA synthase family protein [Oscillospiraceae bacterium]|nr:LTA synthase family protein [Oscillospiraceae bacterium]